MAESPPPAPGLLGAARQFGHSLLGLAQSRIALLGVEWQEEKLRVVRLLVWLGVALALGAAGLFVVVGALALFAWTRAGYAGLGVLASACVILAAAIVWAAWRTIQHGPPPFATTAEEFRRDLEWLRPE
jgi:uncharacterized membrane protein YqjE